MRFSPFRLRATNYNQDQEMTYMALYEMFQELSLHDLQKEMVWRQRSRDNELEEDF